MQQFLRHDIENTTTEEKSNFIKMPMLQRVTSTKFKDNSQKGRKYLQIISDRRLVSRIHKQLFKLNAKSPVELKCVQRM